jgi:putative ABC transport system permease protein
MTTAVLERPTEVGVRSSSGGIPARRAMVRWAWRLFRREWRQQLLILALIIVAVAATVVGSAVATDTPPAANAGFGTANHLAAYSGSDPQLTADIQGLQHRFGNVDIIENQTLSIPGSVDTYQLRSQSPHGPYGQPMLSLVSGSYPTGPGQVAVTSGLASAFNLKIGDIWHQGGAARRVVGLVQNPQSLLDEFGLVAPGQVASPTQVTVLFDAGGASGDSLGPNVHTPSPSGNSLNPETIVLALDTVGMLLIALVGVAGFTVLAQRRLRSIGMLGAVGATDKNIRLVVRANGAVVGAVGALIGAALGLVAWLAYRPRLESNAHHLIGTFQLPWVVIGVSMALAVVATLFAASRPARSITRLPIVSALSGRPAPPKQVHRSAVPGVILLVVAFFLFTIGGSSSGSGGGMPEVVLGFVVLIAAVVLLAPFCLAVLGRFGRRAPIAVRLALRDLSRYRARSASALAAISLGVLIAVVISVVAAGRYGNVLDYAGPNLASNQLLVSTANGPAGDGGPGNAGAVTSGNPQSMAANAQEIATALGTHDITELDGTSANLQRAAPGRNWNGPIYVATPSLLRAFGISASSIDPNADILTMRPGLSTTSDMQLVYGNYFAKGGSDNFPCPTGECLANPLIQTVGALPSGTSAPNTLITEHAVRQLGLQTSIAPAGWFIQTSQPLTAAQIKSAQLTAAAASAVVETKNSAPSSAEIINWATVFGVLLALGILAMTIGLIRSETAGDLRTLSATGASRSTRRSLTAATAGALALLGAVLGTVAGYVAAIGFFRSSAKNGGLAALSSTPTTNLLILLIGMPLIAALGGWLFAGRDVPAIARQPLD